MATAPSFEDILTCPICQDIYKDPKLLICNHTLCGRCTIAMLKQSKKSKEIDCPLCRTVTPAHNIKVDFKTNTLLESDVAKNQLADFTVHNSKKVKLCELCKAKPVVQNCKQCERIICETCSSTHTSIPACKSHTLSSLDGYVKTEVNALFKFTPQIKKQLDKVEYKSKQLEQYQSELDKLCTKTQQELDEWYNDRSTKLREHYMKEKEKIQGTKTKETQAIRKIQQRVNNLKGEMIEHISDIEELTKITYPAKAIAVCETLQERINMSYLDDSTSCIHNPVLPMFEVQKSKPWDESSEFKVNITKSNLELSLASLFGWIIKPVQRALKKTFPSQLENKVMCPDLCFKTAGNTPKKLLVVSNTLWILYDSQLEVHNFEGTWLMTIPYTFNQANGMTLHKDNVVIACLGEGLLYFDAKGTFISTISPGIYCDVASDQASVFAVDYIENKPFIRTYQMKSKTWVLLQQIELPYEKCNPLNSILWDGAYILTTSSTGEGGTLYKYHKSNILMSEQEWPQAIPNLCDVDLKGNVLICDRLNGLLHINNMESMEKCTLTVQHTQDSGDMKIQSAISDCKQGFWVGYKKQIMHYSCYNIPDLQNTPA